MRLDTDYNNNTNDTTQHYTIRSITNFTNPTTTRTITNPTTPTHHYDPDYNHNNRPRPDVHYKCVLMCAPPLKLRGGFREFRFNWRCTQ